MVAILLSFQNVFSNNFDQKKLDSYLESLESNNKFMGSIAISQNGKIIYLKSVGYADIENRIKANENSKYRIGSITKTFTAVLAMKAVEENILDLNQTIDKYFPKFPKADIITVRHLLVHRSGIHNFTNNADYLTWNTIPKTENEMIEIITKYGSDFEPDSKTDYSNSNFVLMTFILQKVFNKPYSELISKYITEPLGLKNTCLGSKIDVKNNECNSYLFLKEWIKETETDISIPLGAGGICSTPSDLVKFSDGLFSGKLLKKESLEIMKTIRDDYGLGLFKFPFYNMTSYGHTGGIDGFTSAFGYFKDGDISFAIISNGLNYNNNNITIAILNAIYNKPYEVPEFTKIVLKSEDLDKYLGVYSSTQIPLKITISKKDNILFAQGSGQQELPLDATGKDKFEFEQIGVVINFNPADNTMILNQGGGKFTFTKDK